MGRPGNAVTWFSDFSQKRCEARALTEVPTFKQRYESGRIVTFTGEPEELDGLPLPEGTVIHMMQFVSGSDSEVEVEFWNARFKPHLQGLWLYDQIIELEDWEPYMESQTWPTAKSAWGSPALSKELLDKTKEQNKFSTEKLPVLEKIYTDGEKQERGSMDRCTCGSDSVGLSPYHSEWCDKA